MILIIGSNLDSSSAKSSLPPIITLVHTLWQIKSKFVSHGGHLAIEYDLGVKFKRKVYLP